MEVKLAKENYFLTKDGKFNQREALKTAGLKAAVCFKPGEVTPWGIREQETDDVLIKRGLNTIISDHVTPSQQVPVSLEFYGIPKIICMYLNNIGMQAADERSMRYTEIKDCADITNVEIEIYNKWMNILQEILWNDYQGFFIKSNGNDEAKARSAIKKIAQENARSFVSVFLPTSLTYTSNFSELNKLALQIKRTLDCPDNTELEELAKPYLKELLDKLIELKVVMTNVDVWDISNELAARSKLAISRDLVYKDPKNLDLNLFANKNQFSGINMPDEWGVNYHITRYMSMSCFAQFQRHRTSETELAATENYGFIIPDYIKPYKNLVLEWQQDAIYVMGFATKYPQGKIIKASANGTLKDLVKYLGGERACNRAQQEIAKLYLEIIESGYKAYQSQGQRYEEYVKLLEPHKGVYRCRTKDYKCPAPCPGGPRENREF